MKILKINGSVYEVIESELMDSANGYTAKVNRFITQHNPAFRFKDEVYFNISIAGMRTATELTEEEFQEELKNKTTEYWNQVADTEISANGGAFTLNQGAAATREAYMKTFGLDRMNFLHSVYGPILESKKRN